MDKTLKAEVEKVFAPDGCLAHVRLLHTLFPALSMEEKC